MKPTTKKQVIKDISNALTDGCYLKTSYGDMVIVVKHRPLTPAERQAKYIKKRKN